MYDVVIRAAADSASTLAKLPKNWAWSRVKERTLLCRSAISPTK